jgi:exopolyphosphatase/guanosine-5'-triphosphate,3'-diphosphate pyrophosphatase
VKSVRKQNTDATMLFVVKTARTFDPDPAHNEQVTTLALALFDGLRRLHGHGPGERRLLEIAGRLHDVGWSRVVSGKHHKLSRDLILELEIPGLDERDRLLCALIARYHTKGMPDASRHRQFASLDPDRRELVEWLAAILRVADGLDCNHTSPVNQLRCDVGNKAITIKIQATRDCRTEIERAREKQDLLEGKTGRRVEYRC